MVKEDGGTVTFKGTKNPAMSTGDALEVGPSPARSPPATAWRPTAAPSR